MQKKSTEGLICYETHESMTQSTLISLWEIADRITNLGLDVESTFQSICRTKKVLRTEPNRINRWISNGDRICDDSTNITSQLERLRRSL